MNFLKKLSAAFVFILLVQQVQGHGSCSNRNDCNWTVNTPWMYKAYARVSKFAIPSTTTDKDCPYNGGNGYAYAYKDNGCANQSASNNYGSWAFSGSVYKNKRICARGFSSSELYYDIIANQANQDEGFEKSEITTGATLFEANTVTVPNINGTFYVKGEDLFSSFEIIMWLPTGQEADGQIDQSKVFWSGKIELVNGEVSLTGDFPKDSYTIEEDANGGFLVTIQNLEITAQLPQGVDGRTDLIEVTGTSDGGPVEAPVISSTLDATAKHAVEMTVFPNPTANLVQISFDASSFQNQTTSIKMYDAMGREVATIFEGTIDNSQQSISADLSTYNLTNGTFFILIQNAEQSFLEKVTYQSK